MNTEQTQWWPSRIWWAAPGAGWTSVGKGRLGLFHNELPFQVLWDGRAQEPEGLSCDYGVVHDGAGRFLLKIIHIFTTLVYKREDWLTTFCLHKNNDPYSFCKCVLVKQEVRDSVTLCLSLTLEDKDSELWHWVQCTYRDVVMEIKWDGREKSI